MTKTMKKLLVGVTLASVIAGVAPALAAGYLTNGLPPAGGTQYPSTLPLTGNELGPFDTGLASGLNPASEAISTGQLSQYMAGAQGLFGFRNLLIGGDASTNLFQRATSGASTTTTVGYGGPDRWFYWSGTSTAMTVSQDTTAGDLPTGASASFKMARTSGQTGVVQMCMAQIVEPGNVPYLQGQTVELDWHAITGANFSAASPYNMTAYVVTGTGTVSNTTSANFAYGLNAGGGGSSGWTGQANATAAVVSLGGVSTGGKYSAVATIPAGATQVGVALCYTPTGTAGTNDYVALDNIQLVRNNTLAGYVSTSVGYSVANGFPALAFERRPQAIETALQERYFYEVKETAAITPIAGCTASSTTVAQCLLAFPVPMRAAPVFTGDGGFTAGFATPTTTAQTTLGACSGLAASTVVTSTVGNPNAALIQCTATTVPAAGSATLLYSNNGAGVIKASAEY